MKLVEFEYIYESNARRERVFVSAEHVSLVAPADRSYEGKLCSVIWFKHHHFGATVLGTVDEVVAKLRGE